jgi:hypothetical protein
MPELICSNPESGGCLVAFVDEMLAGYVLTTGAVRRRDLAYVLGVETGSSETGRKRSRVFVYSRGQWIPPVDLDWNARSCTICHDPAERLIAMSEQGYILALGGGRVVVEPRIAPGDQTPGPLTEVRSIAGRAYAVGTLRQVYVREAPGRWWRIDQTCRASGPHAADYAFRTIDGFSPTDIYAAGWEGEVWHYDGHTWSLQETPTNLAFYCLRCAGDGQVYAVGQLGLILRGRGNRWEVVNHEATENDLWGCEWFHDRLFVASTRVLYELHGDDLIPVDFGDEPPPVICYHLSAADGIMWSIGENAVMEFNGTSWTLIL